MTKPLKAYKNDDFLSSPGARTIRILAEYLEPEQRFNKYRIDDTIVFFGSARVVPLQQAQKEHDDLQSRIAGAHGKKRRDLEAELHAAEMRINMAAFLSMGRLPDPHRGDCTQDGQPSSQGQSRMAFSVYASSCRVFPNAWRVRPAPPGMPS